MFEQLEKGWTENKRTGWGKVALALNILALAFMTFVMVFEPSAIVQPRQHETLRFIYGLALIAFGVSSVLNSMRMRKNGGNSE